MPIASPMPERILVVGNGFVGDTILGIAFLRNLRRRFPGAVIDVLIEAGAAAVLAHCPYVDNLLAWPRPPRWRRLLPTGLAELPVQAKWLRSRGYSRAYLFKRSFSSALLVWLAGIPRRVGHAAECRGWLLSRSVPFRRGRHQAESYLDLLRADAIEVDDGHNENWCSPRDLAVTDPLLAASPPDRPRVFLAVRSTNAAKHWPMDRWAAVIEWLVDRRRCEVFFCGGPADVPMHEEAVERLTPRIAEHVHDLSASVSLRQVGGLLSRMDLCVGIDSGLPHLAASFGVPVAVLFGPTDPAQWHPWQADSVVVQAEPSAATGARSMLDIGVDRVIVAAARLLDARTERPTASCPQPPSLRRSRSSMPIGN